MVKLHTQDKASKSGHNSISQAAGHPKLTGNEQNEPVMEPSLVISSSAFTATPGGRRTGTGLNKVGGVDLGQRFKHISITKWSGRWFSV